MRYPALLAAAASLALPGAALAHARLVASTPAANATVAGPATIDLRFSEPLLAKLSGAELFAADTRKALPAAVAPGSDRRLLRLALPGRLTPGRYRVAYHVVSADTHRISGGFIFQVR